MKKVIIEKSGSINDIIEMLDEEGLYLNNGYDFDFIKEEMLKGGSGIYEFCFGCRSGLENFEKCDEYYSKEELMDEDNEEMLDEFYSDKCEDMLGGKYNFVKCISYFEEGWSLFVKVEV